MIEPEKVREEFANKSNENLKFSAYLLSHADEEELDRQFLTLHNELFDDYDCRKCGNCCKLYYGEIPEEDLEKDAMYLDMTKEQFINSFLEKNEINDNYQTKHKPCDFLQEDGNCKLGECKPEKCKNYPYTNQPKRLQNIYNVLDVVATCPVAAEIYKKIKKEYGYIK